MLWQKLTAFTTAIFVAAIGSGALAQQSGGGSFTRTLTVTGEKPGGFNVTATVQSVFTQVGSNPTGGGNNPSTAQGAQPPAGAQQPPRQPATAAAPAPATFNNAINGLAGQLQQQQQQIANLLQQQQQMQAQNANLQLQANQMNAMARDFLNNRVDRIARNLQRTMYLYNTPRYNSDSFIDALRDYLMAAAQGQRQANQNNGGNNGGSSSPLGGQNNPSGMTDEQVQALASKLEDTMKNKLSDDVAAKVTEQLRNELNPATADFGERPTTNVRVEYDYLTPAQQAAQLDSSQADQRLALLEKARDICNKAMSDKSRTASELKQDRMFMMQLALKFRALQDDATDSGVRSTLDKDITACISAANQGQ